MNVELTDAGFRASYAVPASFGSRAELAKSSFQPAKAAAKKPAQAMNLTVAWTETCRWIVAFMCSLWSMMFVMRRHSRREPIVGEWPGRRVGKLRGAQRLAATSSPQLSLI